MTRKHIELKYTFTCDPVDLYFALHKPDVLSNWMAEKVEFDEMSGVYTFHWSDFSESIRIIDQNDAQRTLKWDWLDNDYTEHEFTQFRVGDADDSWYVDLYIDDYCDEFDEELQRTDWDKHMKRLSRLLN